MSHVTVRKIARIAALALALVHALELTLALALGLKHLLQRTSLCVCIPHTWGGAHALYSCLPPLPQKPLKLEQHHDLSLLVNQLV